MHHGIGHMVGVPSPDIRPGDLPPTSEIWWRSVETRSILFFWGHISQGVTSGGSH